MAGSKYTLDMEVTGNAEKKLSDIADGVNKIAEAAGKMEEGLGAGLFLEWAKTAVEAGEKLIEIGEKVFDHMKEMAESFVDTAKEFEDTRSSLRFSFGKDFDEIYGKITKESQHLAFTFKQSAELVKNMGLSGVNVFGEMGKSMKTFTAKTGEQIGALDVLQDTISGTGLSFAEAGRVMNGVHHAMTGNFKEFQRGLSMPIKVIEEMKHKMATAGPDMQKRFESIVEVLGKFYGGAGKLREQNLSYWIQQLTDKFELLKEAIAGKGGLEWITKGLREFVDALQRLLEDKEAIEVLAGAFHLLEESVGWVFKAAGGFVDFFRHVLVADQMGNQFGQTLFKVRSAVAALVEMWETYNGVSSTMSIQTAENLEKSGMKQWVFNVMGLVHKMNAAWEAFSKEMSTITDKLGPSFSELMEDLGRLFEAFTGVSSDASVTTETFADKATRLADALITVVDWIIKFTDTAVQILTWAQASGTLAVAFDTLKIGGAILLGVLTGMAVEAAIAGAPFIALGAAIMVTVAALEKVIEAYKLWKGLSDFSKADLGQRVDKEGFEKVGADIDARANESRDRRIAARKARGPTAEPVGVSHPGDLAPTPGIQAASPTGMSLPAYEAVKTSFRANAGQAGPEATPELIEAAIHSYEGKTSGKDDKLLEAHKEMGRALIQEMKNQLGGMSVNLDSTHVGNVVAKSREAEAGS